MTSPESIEPAPLPEPKPRACPECGGTMAGTVKTRPNLLDVFGVLVLGAFVLALLVPFLLSAHGGRPNILWIAGAIAFGLYHLVGRRRKLVLTCERCGHRIRGGDPE